MWVTSEFLDSTYGHPLKSVKKLLIVTNNKKYTIKTIYLPYLSPQMQIN